VVTPTSTSTSTTSNNNNDNTSNNDNNGSSNNDGNDGNNGGNDNFDTFSSGSGNNGSTGTIPGVNYPGVLNAQPSDSSPGSTAPRPQNPGVASAYPPVPGVANQAPRPVQTPSVLPVAGQLGTDLPRLAALVGLGLVASGLGLRLRQRMFGSRRAAEPVAPQYEADVADTYIDDSM